MTEPISTSTRNDAAEMPEPGRVPAWTVWAAVLLPLVPILTNHVVSSSDYMMHISRASIIARADLPLFRDAYHVKMVPLPNLAVDLVVPLLMRFLPLAVAGRVFMALGVLLNTTGAVALSGAIHRRLTPLALFLPLLAYSYVFSWGFLGFYVASALALWTFAGYVWSKDRPFGVRAALLAPAMIVVYFAHLSGFALLVLSVGGFEAIRWLGEPTRRASALQGLGALALGLVAPAYVHLRLSPISTSVGTMPNTSWHIRKEILELLNLYYSPLFSAFSLLFWAGFLWLWRTGRVRPSRPTLWLAALLFAVYVACPFQLYGSAFASTRLLPYAVAVLLCAFAPTAKAGRSARVAGTAVALLALQVALVLVHVVPWNGLTDQAMAGARQAPPGSLFVTICRRKPWRLGKRLANLRFWWRESGDNPDWHPNYNHIGDGVALEGEYLPIQLYLLPGKQPVDLDPKYRDLMFRSSDDYQRMTGARYDAATPMGKREMYRHLGFNPIDLTAYGPKVGRQLRTIATEYAQIRRASGVYPDAGTYVIDFHSGRGENPFPGLLREVSHGDDVNVYRVVTGT